MILGIGMDLVQVKRMNRWIIKPKLLERYFSIEEIEDIQKAGKGAARSAAARFAAKEAFGKALGSGLVGLKLTEVVVIKDKFGKPEYKLFGSALNKIKEVGGERVFLSLTHEKEVAAAVAVIESGGGI